MIETIPFGRTGHPSTRTIFGAAALAHMSEARADRVLELLLEFGVNHIDTAARYGDSELHLARWMREHRGQFFLASKTGERSYAGARDSIRRSLERLRVDHLDLIQLHHLVDPEEQEQALGPGGALEAAVEARQQGLVRFIGVTGHGTRSAAAHRKSLERFAFDSVLLPYNHLMMQNPQYAAEFEALVAQCERDGVAVQTIKAIARRRWRSADEARFSWYEPLREPAAIRRAVHWVWARPGFFLNTTSDATLLAEVLEAAARPGPPPSDAALAADVEAFAMEPLFVAGALDEVGLSSPETAG